MDQKTFWRERVSPKTKSYVTWGIMGAIFLCINALISMITFSGIFATAGLAVFVLFLGLTMGVGFKRSRVCAIILLLLFVASHAVSAYYIPMDVFGFILIIAIGYVLVCGMLGTFAFHSEWHAFQKAAAPSEK